MKNIRYILILSSLFVIFIVVMMVMPQPVNWSSSFSRKDKIPYGSYILYELMPALFPGGKIIIAHDPLADLLKGSHVHGYSYIIINNSLTIDGNDAKTIKDYVKKGSAVFLAAQDFSGQLTDDFKINTEPGRLFMETTGVNFTAKKLKRKGGYTFRRNTASYYFKSYDKNRSRILGVDQDGRPNFIRVGYGRGYFYFSAVPFAFTNYNMLQEDNYRYAFTCLSYLPIGNAVWDEFYKSYRIAPATPLRYILTREPLRWAYYVLMVGLILLIIFKARRRQRIIPKIDPLPNTTLEFVETVGRLYYQQRDHNNIADKMIIYFYEKIRSRYNINAFHINEKRIGQLSRIFNISDEDIRLFFGYIDRITRKKRISDNELLKLSRLIEAYNKRIPGF